MNLTCRLIFLSRPKCWFGEDESLTRRNAWFKRGSSASAASTIAAMLSGITVRNTPPKNNHDCFAARDHRVGRLTQRQPHETVPRITRCEDQRVHDPVPFRRRVEHQPHAAEVDLALIARLAIGDAHRRSRTPGAAAHLEHVTLHRAARHVDTAAVATSVS